MSTDNSRNFEHLPEGGQSIHEQPTLDDGLFLNEALLGSKDEKEYDNATFTRPITMNMYDIYTVLDKSLHDKKAELHKKYKAVLDKQDQIDQAAVVREIDRTRGEITMLESLMDMSVEKMLENPQDT